MGAGKGGRPGCGKCGGPAPSLGAAAAATAAAAAAAAGDRRGYAGDRRSEPAERCRLGEKLTGPGLNRAGLGRGPEPRVDRGEEGRWMGEGRRARDSPALSQALAELGRAGPGMSAEPGAPALPGGGAAGAGRSAPAARGAGAADWGPLPPPRRGRAAWLGPRGGSGPAVEGPAARCGKVAGLCGGAMGAGTRCPQHRRGCPPDPASFSATSLPTSPAMLGKVCGGQS